MTDAFTFRRIMAENSDDEVCEIQVIDPNGVDVRRVRLNNYYGEAWKLNIPGYGQTDPDLARAYAMAIVKAAELVVAYNGESCGGNCVDDFCPACGSPQALGKELA